MDIIQQIETNMYERAKLLIECEKPEIRSTVFSICKRDPIYFFKYFVCTDRNTTLIPSKFGNTIPMILFPFQEEFVNDAWDAIQMGQIPIEERTEPTDVFSEKSRQMGFSWIFAGLQLYAYIFHDLKSLYISKKAEEVDKNGDMKSHFEKIRFMIRGLPNWILPKGLSKDSGTDHNKFMNISRGDGTGSIIGESANPNAGRGGTFAFVIFDEMAFMQYAGAINMSISSATPCRFFNSTPYGEGNEYYRMRKLALTTDEFGKPQTQKIRYHRCHWSEHPFYTKEWYDWKTKGMTREQIAQELEIDYNIALEGRVYPEYKAGKYENTYDDYLPLYLAIDNSHGGTDPHALIVCQQDGHYLNVIDTCEFNCSVTDMAQVLAKQPTMTMTNKQLDFYNKYVNYKTPIFVSDPYDTHATLNQSTIFEEYQKVGLFLNTPQNRKKKDQIMKTKANLYRLRVNADCTDFHFAIQNCKYPEVKEGHNRVTPNELPIHDQTSHMRTALEYLITYITENEQVVEEEKVLEEIRNPVTGELTMKFA